MLFESAEVLSAMTPIGKLLFRCWYRIWHGEQSDTKAFVSMRFAASATEAMDVVGQLAACNYSTAAFAVYRAIIERAALYTSLCKSGDCRVFSDWCFKEVYENQNLMKGDQTMPARLRQYMPKLAEQDQARYNRVRADADVISWRRPQPKEMLGHAGMRFLYSTSYDYASAFVHPTTYDGIHAEAKLLGRVDPTLEQTCRFVRKHSAMMTWWLFTEMVRQPEYHWDSEFCKVLSEPAVHFVAGATAEILRLIERHNGGEEMATRV